MPKRRDWGGWARIHADVPKNGAFCGGCIYCDHEDGACTITSASIWDIGKGGWRKCKHYTLYSIADTFKHKLEEFDFSGASEYLKEHSGYITEKDYAQIRGILDEFQAKSQHKDSEIDASKYYSETTSQSIDMGKMNNMYSSSINKQNVRVVSKKKYTPMELDDALHNAYIKFRDWVDHKISADEALDVIAPVCKVYGLDVDYTVLSKMFIYALYDIDPVSIPKKGKVIIKRQIKSFDEFKKFIKGGWKNYIHNTNTKKIVDERRDCQ